MKRKKKINWVWLMIIIIGFMYILPTVAKYITDKATSYYLRSKHFYFSSNLLDEHGSTYRIGTWGGVGDFSVSFELYSKENQYLFSDADISYTVSATCSQGVTCTLNKNSGVLYSNDANHLDSITVSVNPQRVFLEGEEVHIDVVATTVSPYVKTVRASFQYVVGAKGVSYYITDAVNSPYLLLHVTNDVDYCTVITAFNNYTVGTNLSYSVYRTLSSMDKPKCVSKYISLDFDPDDLLLDNTSSVLDIATYDTEIRTGITYINSLDFAIDPNSTMAIKFYKLDPTQNYTYPLSNNTSIITVGVSDPT